ncbi:MAG: pyruvate ferredoxin oxidoreductase [Candidatus Saganbacteria bacterium]|nr:pyruvate ferredoxin oxidoreductase [Candidatus Saganbacteria bacterium]
MPFTVKTGNEAMAEAMRQINPDVVAAYPITPATEIAQIFTSFVSDGKVDTEFIAVESEHSAMSACVGASTTGVRVMTATSSQGLALMYEILPIASALRLPIVMPVVNRALSAPINIHCDHSDTMAARDFGWIHIFSENAQEAYDNVLQAVRIAEAAKLPVMVTTDGFIISHCTEKIEVFEDKVAKDYLGEYAAPVSLLDIDKPVTIGALDLQDYYFEHRIQAANAMTASKDIISGVSRDFGKRFKREYDLFEKVQLDDAEIAIICMGSTAGTAKAVIDELRAQGIKAGMLKLRVFRPFPFQEIAGALSNVKVVAALDRSDGLNSFGAQIFTELRSSLYELPSRPAVVNYIYGLGGRDINMEDIKKVYFDLRNIAKTGKVEKLIQYLGARE